jgi:hypothetical protein
MDLQSIATIYTLSRHAPRKRGIQQPEAMQFGRAVSDYWIARLRGR